MTLKELTRVLTPNTRLRIFFEDNHAASMRVAKLARACPALGAHEVLKVIPFAAYEVEVHIG